MEMLKVFVNLGETERTKEIYPEKKAKQKQKRHLQEKA